MWYGVPCPGCKKVVDAVAPNGEGCVDCITEVEVSEARYNGRRLTDDQIAKLIAGMKSRGAHYPNDNFYGLVHETAHGFDLGCSNADPGEINRALMARGEWERLTAEVVAKSTARYVSAYYGTELFRDGVRYAAVSVKKFAERDGAKVCWAPADFVDETVRIHKSPRVRAVIRQVLATLNRFLDE